MITSEKTRSKANLSFAMADKASDADVTQSTAYPKSRNSSVENSPTSDQGHVLSESHGSVGRVYLPHGGILSCVVELIGRGAIETGMIGKDGQFGGGAAFDHRVSLNVA